MKYFEINEKNIISKYRSGIESDIFLYNLNGNIVLLKLIKNTDVIKNKEEKLTQIINSNLLDDEVKIIGGAKKNGTFIGYFIEPSYEKTFDSFQKRTTKINQLKKLRDKVSNLNKNNIYIGDFNEGNILYDKKSDDIKLCDLDNFKINDLDFDLKSSYVNYFRQRCSDDTKIDDFCFNVFTISYLERIYLPYVLNYLISNNLPEYFSCEENEDIRKRMIILNDSYEKGYLIDHIK